jgi:2-keto-myo-inositol isomerase
MKFCASQATTLTTSFADDVVVYAAAGFPALEVWLTKLETHLETHSGGDTLRLLDDNRMSLAAAAGQGGLLLSEGDARRAHFDHLRRRLELCALFAIPTLVVTADVLPPAARSGGRDALAAAVAALAEAADLAAPCGVRLALEFHARSPVCASLDTAVALAAAAGRPNVGVALDLFHYYTGPSKFEDLDLLSPANLFHVQVCDLAGVPRELAADADRVLPGDGDFQLGPIVQRLRDIGYDGWVSLELMNPILWQVKLTQVAEVGLAALQRLLNCQ